MKKIMSLFLFFLVIQNISFAQDNTEWKPYFHATGYVNTIAEYTDLDNGFEDKKSAGIGLSEAAFLASYKPLENLEFKGTFVYTHYIEDIQDLVVEAYGTYSFSDKFRISAGKYLTPLSPINQYFYAPLNPSASLPMVVSHHFLLPQSISGFQVSGEFGSDIKLGYNITYGHYLTLGHPRYGILGFQGREDIATYQFSLDEENKNTKEYLLGGSGRLYANFKEIVNIGFNYFDGRESTQPIQELTPAGASNRWVKANKYSVGLDLQLKLGALKINSEAWYGKQETNDDAITQQLSNDYSAFYGEAIYEAGIFSPYVRYDNINDIKGSIYMPYPDLKLFDAELVTNAYTVGLAIRPIYELLLKLEYRYIDSQVNYSNVSIPPALEPVMPSENPLSITANTYNHFLMSLVLSF